MPDSPSERRSVPDLESIEVGGQRLTRLRRRTRPERAEPRPDEAANGTAPIVESVTTLEDLARKHLGPDPAATLEEHGEFLRALAEPDDSPPPVAELAGRLELFSDTGAIPNPETNPDKREDGTLSPIVTTDDAPDFLSGHSPPETIFDLFQLFPQLDGVNWWIYVNRKKPEIYSGLPIAGVQRPISRPLSMTEWQGIYGGGTFELIVYGPPKVGVVLDAHGRIPAKKLTHPIVFKFPGTPSLEGMMYDETDSENSMSQPHEAAFRVPSRPLSIGEAQVKGKEVEVAAEREKRAETREEAARREARELREAELKNKDGIMSMLLEHQRESAKREAEFRRELLEQQQRFEEKLELAREQARAGEKPDDVDRFVKIAQNLGNSGGDTEAIRASHAQEVKHLQDQRQRDAERNDTLLKDERARADRAIQDAQTRADQRIKDAEERFHNNERDARERAQAEIQRAKDEAERRISDQHRQNEIRVSDLDRNHTRDMDALKAAHAMALESLKNTYDMRLETARGDAKRSQSDADRARAELEDHKDIPKQITKIKELASELGMSEGGDAEPAEPETLGQTLAKVGMNLAGSLPQVVESLGGMFGKRSEQELQAARMQGRQEMIQQAGGFGGGAFGAPPALTAPQPRPRRLQPIEAVQPAPLVPGQEPFRQAHPHTNAPRPIPGMEQPEEQLRQEFLARAQAEMPPESEFAPAAPGENPFHTGMPPEPNMRLAAHAPSMSPSPSAPAMPPSVAPPPAAPDPALASEDAQLLQAEPLLLMPLESGESPAEVARGIASQYPKDAIAGLLAQLGSADRVLEAFARNRSPDHPFNRYTGKKFIRGLFAELGKIVNG